MVNFIIGIMGKKGSGKTELCKKAIRKQNRVMVIDTLEEYSDNVIIYDPDDLKYFLQKHHESNFHISFRPTTETAEEEFFNLAIQINNYVLILEEVDRYCSTHRLNQDCKEIIKYGRHKNRNVIWISRSPFEIHRDLTRQEDLLITFRQTEPRDLDYMKGYNFITEKEHFKTIPATEKTPEKKELISGIELFKDLEDYEYAYHGDEQLIEMFK